MLRALGVEEELAHTRFASGSGGSTPRKRSTTCIDLVATKVEKLRELSPLYEMAKEGIDLKSITWAAH